eukprot:SAG31_NODE_4989_length_2817_cov_1.583517_4_plen_160_part_00
MGVLMMGKNSTQVRDKRISMLSQWLNAALAILEQEPLLCRFLGVSAEYIGVTIVGMKGADSYQAHNHLYEVRPMGRKKGLSAIDLPSQLLFGCDHTGVQLFNASDRSAVGSNVPHSSLLIVLVVTTHMHPRRSKANVTRIISFTVGLDMSRRGASRRLR